MTYTLNKDGHPIRGENSRLTRGQKRALLRTLKQAALDGDVHASLALSNFELAEATRQQLEQGAVRAAA